MYPVWINKDLKLSVDINLANKLQNSVYILRSEWYAYHTQNTGLYVAENAI